MKFLEQNRATILRIIGVLISLVTIYSLYAGTITWIWDGLVGCSISVLLIWMPESVAKLILGIINKLTKKLLSNGDKEQIG
jgi:ABC-type lipoprotein release transport system permease subunit